ncbi:MAG TPA: FHA domain-containing protein [Iamia sp.]|jgi:pSer/pThr/pTyr-binding forkhead associated (FHA) protein|nr:FHA domain-containing protein [Iamia sp.]
MNLSEGRLAPVPGADGLVTRTAGAVLFVAGRTPVDLVRRLTDAVAATTSATPARALARDLAALVAADDAAALPGFAVIAASDAGTYVKVYGSVEVHLMGTAAEETLTGVGSFTGVDREVAGTFHTIAVNPAGAPVPSPVFDVDVQAGTAPGNGFSITTLTSPTDAAVADVPPAAPPAAPPSSSSEADAVAAMSVVSEPTPAPPAAEVSVSPPADAESNPFTSSASTEAMAAEEAAAAAAAAAAATPVLDAPTQAWTPSTVDFDADDLAQAEAANAAPAPAWGSPEPDAPASAPTLDKGPPDEVLAPDGGLAPTAVPEAPGTPTPPPDGSSLVSPPTAPPPSAPEPVPFEALPVADVPVEDPAPPAFEAATVALPSAPVAGTPAPAPASDAPPAEFTSQLLGALDEEEPEDREALPVETDPGAVRQPDQVTAEVHVQGVICSRGHFNDPRSRFCSSCGISMVQNTQILTQGPRPPLGVMVFEDGATFSLSSDYVVGRQPDVSELVQQGLALPLPVDDPERSISRAHAELRLVDWDVHLVNLSGTNGSFVWDENGQQWVPIPEGQSVVLTPGMRIALGRRSAVFESSLVR